MKKTILLLLLIGLSILIFIGVLGYFTSGVSSVTPPIKQYQYIGTVDELISGFKKYSETHANLTFNITDTVGNQDNGYAYYMTIALMKDKHNITYRLKCEQNKGDKTARTNVDLVLAFDETNKTGGYQKKSKGVEPLVNNFDVNFLTPLRNSQSIKITPL